MRLAMQTTSLAKSSLALVVVQLTRRLVQRDRLGGVVQGVSSLAWLIMLCPSVPRKRRDARSPERLVRSFR